MQRVTASRFFGKKVLGNCRAEKGLKGTFAEQAESLAHVLGLFFPEHVAGTVAGNALRTTLSPFEMKRDQAAPQGWLVEDGEFSHPALTAVL